MGVVSELRRRNVFRMAVLYIVAAWLILQVADVFVGLANLPEWIGPIILGLLAVGFPIALILSWFYELTPEGITLEKDVRAAESITYVTGRRMDFVIIAILSAGLLLFAWHTWWPTAPIDNSIAVLAFDDMSTAGDQEYLADGVAEEVTNLLAKIPELQVSSRSSSFAFKGQKTGIPAIAESLGVSYVLEGSLRMSGRRLRITAQLIEARSDKHVWSETYEETLDDIFTVQDKIAAAVVNQLKVSLLGDLPTSQKADPEAFRLYLLANYVSGVGADNSDYKNAESLYKRALAIDPNFAPAYRKLALMYRYFGLSGEITREESILLQAEVLERAIEADPTYAPIYTSLAGFEGTYKRDLAKAAYYLKRAIDLDPFNATVLQNAAVFLSQVGRIEEAISICEYLISRNPNSTWALSTYARISSFGGYQDQAISTIETLLSIRPGARRGALFLMGQAYLLKGEAEKALELFEQEPHELLGLVGKILAHHDLGQSETSDALFETLVREYGQSWPMEMAEVSAYRNDADMAFEWLGIAARNQVMNIGDNWNSPFLANIRTDPRWLRFLESVNLSPAELDEFDFQITLPE
jgi:TolB-like protein